MVMRQEVPYIRIIRHIPREMRDKLPQEYIALFEIKVRSHAYQYQAEIHLADYVSYSRYPKPSTYTRL